MNKNKKIILAIVVTILVLSGLILVGYSKNSEIWSFSDESFGFLKSIQPITTPPVIVATSSTPRIGDAKTNTPLYVEMIAKIGGYRFQFSNNCASVSPSTFVIKNGVQFMVDNRDSKAHEFSFSGQKYKVSSFGYAIITASKIGDQSLYCDGIQRVKVNVQK